MGTEYKSLLQQIKDQMQIPTPEGVTCSKCKRESYCSPSCQTESWQNFHTLSCKFSRKDAFDHFMNSAFSMKNDITMFILKILHTTYAQLKSTNDKNRTIWKHINRLCFAPSRNPGLPEAEHTLHKLMEPIFPPEFANEYILDI